MRNLFLLGVLAASGCWSHVEDHCSTCTIVEHTSLVAPPVRSATRAVVVLVHGAFGFGEEWDPVVAALAKMTDTETYAFRWPGPWRDAPKVALALATTLQGTLDALDRGRGEAPQVREVLVLAHSAGGMIANYAARLLRVPPSLRVTVALLDSPLGQRVSPVVYEHEVDTPIGVAIGARQLAYPPVPHGVSMVDYKARAQPSASTQQTAARASAPPDVPRVYVGKVGHNPMLGKVALPLLVELDHRVHGLAPSGSGSPALP